MDIRFTIGRLLLRGLHYRLAFAALIVAFVAVSAGFLVFLLDPNFEDPGDAVWWSFLRLSDPGYLGDDEGVVSVTISTVVTVLGYVLFLGLLVAILTQWMNTLILRVESGTTPVAFENHILVLGWNQRTPSIVLELLQTGGRVSRFLQDSGAHKLRIVILAEHVDAELREDLKSSLGAHWDDRRVVLRSGSAAESGWPRTSSVSRCRCGHPSRCRLRNWQSGRGGLGGHQNARVHFSSRKASGHAPLAVAALYNANRTDVAQRAYAGELEVIAADQLVSRLIAQCTLQPGLWPVYRELFSLDEDNALFTRELDGDQVTDIGQARLACPNAVVIGVIPSEARGPILNPPSDRQLKSGDSLIYIAKHFADCVFADAVTPSAVAQVADWQPAESEMKSVLVLGWSRMVPKVLAEVLSYQQERLKIDVVGIYAGRRARNPGSQCD